MTSHRRVVRMSSSDADIIKVPVKEKPLFKKFFSSLIYCFLVIFKGFWYCFQRLFLVVLLIGLTVGLAWWLSQAPSLYRHWEKADEVLPKITWSGSSVNIENVRDHIWTTDTEFNPRYLNLTYSLDEIQGLDYIITPFSEYDGPAHTMFSFSFSGGRHIVVSAEIRKEKGESFDAVSGILNQYELAYVVATEDDIIKIRTNYRKNQVYMYPINTTKENIQSLFRSMLIRADKLTREPEFYNTLWNNCTTSILRHVNSLRTNKLLGGKYTLLPAHSDEVIYDARLIDTSIPLSELRIKSRIDERARSISGEEIFSEKIRSLK